MIEKQLIRPLRYVLLPDGSRADSFASAVEPGRIVSVIGAGGKTSTLFTLGWQLAAAGKTVMLTTSTRIRPFENPFPAGLQLTAFPSEKGKLQGPEEPDLLAENADHLLIEADGSKGLPVKAPADHEPAISKQTDHVIAVLGLSGIGKPIAQVCHRPERVCALLHKNGEELLTAGDAALLIESDEGLRKDVGSRRFTVILNQADTEREVALGRTIAAMLSSDIRCLLTAYENFD